LINSSQARSSCFNLPGITVNPFPNGVVAQGDRQQISDMYAGILAQIPNFIPNETCWIDERYRTDVWTDENKEIESWVHEIERSDVWAKAGSSTSTWRSENRNTSAWTDEKEVQPCGD
jgi:hypothetical protein